jgi:cyclophilin family peptidyl-prolyl cis-trans isomerase
MRKPILAGMLLLLPLPAIAQVYADFQTSVGNFTCELDYQTSARTVANFITLAEGRASWLDETSGQVSTTDPAQPFYDGLRFHRVVNEEGFRILQAGSREDDGSDGPGYVIPDEFQPDAPETQQHKAYQLSMANSGPNSGGSQFFITGTAIPSLDGKHTVFGKVVSGLSVVESILTAATDDRDKPIDPITLQHVSIRKVGPEAAGFDPSRFALPKVSTPDFQSQIDPGDSAVLTFDQPPQSLLHLWASEDGGSTWEDIGTRFIGAGEKPASSVQFSLADTPEDADLRFRPVLTTYPGDSIVPSSLSNHQLYLENESGDFTFHFDSEEPSYLIVLPSGETKTGRIVQFLYEPDGYGATLVIETAADGAFRYRLAPKTKSKTGFTGTQRGSFYNLLYGWIPFEENSDFALSPLPSGP